MVKNINRYIADYHRPAQSSADLPFFYNERASVGCLAGGVWRSNPANLVLEEYGSTKKTTQGDYRGRSDFWARVENKCIYLEAKQVWECLSGPQQSAKLITDKLHSEYAAAWKNARHDLAVGALHHVYGTVFSVPYLDHKCFANWQNELREYNAQLGPLLAAFSKKTGLHVLRASCLWPSIVCEGGFYSWKNYEWCHPILDVYFATKPLR
jgi:hypothetical protein